MKAACCTPFAQAKCSDWVGFTCASGQMRVGTNNAPPDGTDGKSLTQAKYREMCCAVPMKCADYTVEETTSSVSQGTASMVTVVLAFFPLIVA